MIGTGYSTFKEIEASDKKIYSDFFESADSVNKSLHEAISISQKFKKQRSLKKHFNFMQNLLSFFYARGGGDSWDGRRGAADCCG